jgi:hypothetical protein
MFDANMRYISKGKRFFCKLHSLTKDSPLAPFGARRGSVILCEMLDQTAKCPRVKFIFPDGEVIMKPVYRNIHTWAVYEGSEKLTDFISDDSKQMAEQYIQQLKEGE